VTGNQLTSPHMDRTTGTETRQADDWLIARVEVLLETKQLISETIFPANLSANTEKSQRVWTKVSMFGHVECQIILVWSNV